MKTRNGFVSNSSSTSYIIAIQKVLSDCPHCKRHDIDLINYLQNSNESDNAVHETNAKELVSNIARDDWRENEEKNKVIKKIQSYDDTWNIIHIDISYHDETAQHTLDNLVRSGNAEIIIHES